MTKRRPHRGRKTRRHSLPANYTYTPDPNTASQGQRLAHAHRLSVQCVVGHSEDPGERHEAKRAMWRLLNTSTSSDLCAQLDAAQDSHNIERIRSATADLLTHLNHRITYGWEVVVGDAALFTRPR